MDNESIRLEKYLAGSGFTSRRKVSQLLQQNQVRVNGQIILEPGFRIIPGKDEVIVGGKKIFTQPEKIYYLLNKPYGVVSTASDEQGRLTVVSLIKSGQRIFPVGRLDQNSTGLILLTNDGELANQLTHPKFQTPKTYEIEVAGQVTPEKLNKLRDGVKLKEGTTAKAEVNIFKLLHKRTVLTITIHEGKNHQVKRMCSQVGLEVIKLKRIALGPLLLGDLKAGQYRQLTTEEIKQLQDYSGNQKID